MSDDENEAVGPAPVVIPPINQIDLSLVERWVGFDPDEHLQLKISRADIDNLFFSIQQLTYAVSAVQRSVVAISEMKVDDANAHHVEAQAHNAQAVNHITTFLSALMAKAESVS